MHFMPRIRVSAFLSANQSRFSLSLFLSLSLCNQTKLENQKQTNTRLVFLIILLL